MRRGLSAASFYASASDFSLSPPGRGPGHCHLYGGEGRVLAKALPISVGAHPVRDRKGDRYAAVAHWVRSYREKPALQLWPLTSPPLCREQAGGGIARRVAGRKPASGSSGQDALSIHPASRLRPRKGRGIGVAFLLALPPSRWLLLFGHPKRSNPGRGSGPEARRRQARSRHRDNRRLTKLGDQPSAVMKHLRPAPGRRTLKTGAKGCRAQGALLQGEGFGLTRRWKRSV